MIHVDRSRVPIPPLLASATVAGERAQAATFFASNPGTATLKSGQRFQERYEWNWPLLQEVRPALVDLFQNKCAFCESFEGKRNPLEVGHFRPVTEIVEESTPGAKSASTSAARSSVGYWWLAYDWENLYLMCRACSERSV